MHKIKPPAFLKHAPAEIVYLPLTADESDLLKKGLALGDGQLLHMQATAYQFPYGFYRFHPASSPDSIFLKVLPKAFLEVETFSLNLEQALAEAGVNSRKMTALDVNIGGEELLVIQSPFLDFERFQVTHQNMTLLGKQLKQLHKTLKTHSLNHQAKHNWLEKKQQFDQLFEWVTDKKIMSLLTDAGIDNQQISVFRQYYFLLDFNLLEAQMVHGDLNIGNVLMLNHQPWIIDFENARYSYFPTRFDVGMVLERLCLQQVGIEQFAVYADSFFNGYGERPQHLIDSMRALSVRSMALLLENYLIKKYSFNAAEWQKFYRNLLKLEKLSQVT